MKSLKNKNKIDKPSRNTQLLWKRNWF